MKEESIERGQSWSETRYAGRPSATRDHDGKTAFQRRTWRISTPTWDSPGHGIFYENLSNGIPNKLSVWDDGRYRFTQHWLFGLGHREVGMSIKLWFQFLDSGHPVVDLPKLGKSIYLMGKDIVREPLVIKWDSDFQRNFELLDEPTVGLYYRMTVTHGRSI